VTNSNRFIGKNGITEAEVMVGSALVNEMSETGDYCLQFNTIYINVLQMIK